VAKTDTPASPPKLAVVCDPLDEGWASMNLVADMLYEQLREAGVPVDQVRPPIRRFARRVPRLGTHRAALNVDRLLGRYVDYPARLYLTRSGYGVFHLVDHSYAQLLHVLPEGKAGVFLHDLDTFRCLLEPERDPRPAWFRALVRRTLTGLEKAAVVFHHTQVGREEILRHRVVPAERLVQAPCGVAPEFLAPALPPLPEALQTRLSGRPYLLHVGSTLRRKRLDVLFEVFARLRARFADLLLVQKGALFEAAHHQHLARLGIADAVIQATTDAGAFSSREDRAVLAALYRGATLFLFPSDAEGFGLPVIEALASGTRVVASDIPVLREVGGDAVTFCPVGEVEAWTDTVAGLLQSESSGPTPAQRQERAALFSWRRHADIIRRAYAERIR
jgi:glycosyltransferase involved in cell wall biosynthesis